MTQSEMAEAVAYAMAVFPNATPEVIARLKATRDYLYQSCAVPRCDQCAHWFFPHRTLVEYGACQEVTEPHGDVIATPPDFGCVKFRPKGKAGE